MIYGYMNFSFNTNKIIFGPFSSVDEAWNYIEKLADEEYDRDVNTNVLTSVIIKNKNTGEIFIKKQSSNKTYIQKIFIFKVEERVPA